MRPQAHSRASLARICSWAMLLVLIAALSLNPASGAAASQSSSDNSENLKIDLLLSGGGFRAAAFSYGVLAGLNEICVVTSASQEPRFESRKDEQENLKPCAEGTPLLDQVNIISAVSGGAITAAYYKIHREEFFEEFPKLLKKSNMQWRLLTTEKPPTWKRTLRGPVFFLTGIMDFIESLIGLPLSLLNLNIELTPLAVMTFSDGLLEAEQLTTVYRDLFFQNAHLGDLDASNGFPVGALFGKGKAQSTSDSSLLLINATDITNGMVFTFDERTFECMGIKSERDTVELALAVSASSGLPGVFSPLRIDNVLKQADPSTIPSDCPPILADRTHKPLLVDGGVTDNLGAIGLLRTVMKRKEGVTTNGFTHHAESRKEKHLLVVINSEAESDSKLPGLAGHFDSSYDVLIRSKKDLVRVMTSNMLQNFGFETVELRLSDLVTADPALVKLTAAGTEMKVGDLIPRAMNLVEKEQKIERSLDQIGMLPSPAEIDTLISAGRKVASNRLEDLRRAFGDLRNKEFMDNCASIANPDRYWCWPDQFRANDLESGGGSAFLKTLTEVTTEFRANTTVAQQALSQELLLQSAKLARQELQLFSSGSPDAKRKALLEFLSFMTDQDHQPDPGTESYKLLEQAALSIKVPAKCQTSYDGMMTLLRARRSKWEAMTFDDSRANLIDILDGHSEATCFTEYHMIRSFLEILDLPSDDELNKKDILQVAYWLQKGLIDTRPTLQPFHLHHYMGILLSWYFESPAEGLHHFRVSIDLAQQEIRTLQDLLNSQWGRTSDNRTRITSLVNRFRFFLYVENLHWAFTVLASPTLLPGDASKIPDEEIFAWEKRYLHDHAGKSLMNTIVAGRLDNTLLTELDEQIDSLNKIELQNSGLLSHLRNLSSEIKRALSSAESYTCPPKISEQKDLSKNMNLVICSLVDRTRETIRKKLSTRAGMREARAILQNLYSEYKTHKKESPETSSQSHSIGYLGPDILQSYGLLHIREAMQESCPLRSRTINSARSSLRQAIDGYHEMKNRPGTEEAINTTTLYLDFAERLDCSQALNF